MTRKIEFPRIVMVGKECLQDIGSVASEIAQGKNILLIQSQRTAEVAGNIAKKILESNGFNVTTKNAELADEKIVSESQVLIKEKKINLVVGIGGGTCIDVAKLSSSREKLPFISVPTIASHDGITSPIASIKVNGEQKSFTANAPIAILADTKIISTAPHRFIASGCGDLVANYTAVEDWKLSHKLRNEHYGDYAAALAIMSAEVILNSAPLLKENTPESVKIVMEGLISSGAAMCITGNSRPCSGAEHQFSHALDRISPKRALHGEQCGVGTIMMAYLHKLDWEFFRDALKTIGTPVTAKELGIEDKYIIQALTMAHTIRDRYTILGTTGLSKEAAEELVKKTGVI